jgi:uncharacterized protein (DUF983 family)
MDDHNDTADGSAIGVLTIIVALLILVTFIVFLVLNLRHWKSQTYKIRVSYSTIMNIPNITQLLILQNTAVEVTEFNPFVGEIARGTISQLSKSPD